MALAIEAEGIFKTFRSGWWKKREKEALKGVDLRIEEREIFGILGPNGAGKTTLLSIYSSLTAARFKSSVWTDSTMNMKSGRG